jgi:hypothetical protein
MPRTCGSIRLAVRALEEKPGDDAMEGLRGFVDDAGRRWKDDVLSLAVGRFDRRLGNELGHSASHGRRVRRVAWWR